MATSFNYVQGDTGPQVRLLLTNDDTNTPTDLTGATATLHFRAAGATTVLFSRLFYIDPADATAGEAILQWQTEDLNQVAGVYEGEVEVVKASGLRETLYETLRFRIREDFA
tara:strand:+ start:251 stop:586 length:336 start_codon:yes stop_codon:yes gene_type:complete